MASQHNLFANETSCETSQAFLFDQECDTPFELEYAAPTMSLSEPQRPTYPVPRLQRPDSFMRSFSESTPVDLMPVTPELQYRNSEIRLSDSFLDLEPMVPSISVESRFSDEDMYNSSSDYSLASPRNPPNPELIDVMDDSELFYLGERIEGFEFSDPESPLASPRYVREQPPQPIHHTAEIDCPIDPQVKMNDDYTSMPQNPSPSGKRRSREILDEEEYDEPEQKGAKKGFVCSLVGHNKCQGKASKTKYQHEKHLRDKHSGHLRDEVTNKPIKHYACFFCRHSFAGQEHVRRHIKEHCHDEALTRIKDSFGDNAKEKDVRTAKIRGIDGVEREHQFVYTIVQGKRSGAKKVYAWVISKKSILDFVVFQCPRSECAHPNGDVKLFNTAKDLENHTAETHYTCECCSLQVIPGRFHELHKSKKYHHDGLFIRCQECAEIFNRTQRVQGEFEEHYMLHGGNCNRNKRRKRHY